MPIDPATGIYTLPISTNYPAQADTTIQPDDHNMTMEDVALAISTVSTSGSDAAVTQDSFTGDGITVAFQTSGTPYSVEALTVTVGGSGQAPGSFTLSGQIVTFTEAPPSGVPIVMSYTV